MDVEKYTGKGSEKLIARELMGKVVCATKHLSARRDRRHKTFTEVPCNIVGWVTGIRRLQEGTIVSDYLAYPENYHYSYLDVTNTIPVLLVTTWPSRKPYYVPLTRGAFEFTDEEPQSGLKWANTPENERYREYMREWSKDFPRDEKGRFISN